MPFVDQSTNVAFMHPSGPYRALLGDTVIFLKKEFLNSCLSPLVKRVLPISFRARPALRTLNVHNERHQPCHCSQTCRIA